MADPSKRLAPGSVIGILGGGQLGRMLAMAAGALGLKCHIFCPDPDSAAFAVAADRTIADYDDRDALRRFAETVDVVTYEFENVPLSAVDFLADAVAVWPDRRSLQVSQDRLQEKRFIAEIGIRVAPFAAVGTFDDLAPACSEIGLPSILKSRRFGYDGKGQARIDSLGEIQAAWKKVGLRPAVLEAFVPFEREVSVVAIRSVDGAFGAYEVTENVHVDHILHTATVPATIDAKTRLACSEIARLIADGLEHVGILAVEFFIVREGGGEVPVVNEIAPRVHNSGHWTEDGCLVSQFENHVRAIARWPLGSTDRHHDAVMTNLVGNEIGTWVEHAADPSARVHIYGKTETRPGRKMGHVNRLARRLAP